MSSTARKTSRYRSTFHIDGTELYQTRARIALPILVRQAKIQQPIYYSDLAAEIGMPNPRNLNYVLGAIGNDLLKLGKMWQMKIPGIQALVISKEDEMPGDGFYGFLDINDFKALSRTQQMAVIRTLLNDIFVFKRWDEVLRELNLPQASLTPPGVLERTRKMAFGAGESQAHMDMKRLIYEKPELVKVRSYLEKHQEFIFESADKLDVLLIGRKGWTGVEVKPANAPVDDIARGLFQVIKYQALIEAHQRVRGIKPNAEVVLAIGGKFPKELESMRNTLGVTVFEDLQESASNQRAG